MLFFAHFRFFIFLIPFSVYLLFSTFFVFLRFFAVSPFSFELPEKEGEKVVRISLSLNIYIMSQSSSVKESVQDDSRKKMEEEEDNSVEEEEEMEMGSFSGEGLDVVTSRDAEEEEDRGVASLPFSTENEASDPKASSTRSRTTSISSGSHSVESSDNATTSEDPMTSTAGSKEENESSSLSEEEENEGEEPQNQSEEHMAESPMQQKSVPALAEIVSDLSVPATETHTIVSPSLANTNLVKEASTEEQGEEVRRNTHQNKRELEEKEEEEGGAMDTEDNPHGVSSFSSFESNHSSSTFQQIACAVSEFQAILHESVISTALENSAAALTHTLQQLLQMHMEEAAAFRDAQEKRYEAQLASYREAIESMTVEMRREREGKARMQPTMHMGSTSEREENEEGEVTPGSSLATEKENLLADFVQATGRVKLLEQDVQLARGVNQQLRKTLQEVVKDNNSLREQLTLLQINSIPRKEYDEEVLQHQKTKHELDRLKVEVESMEVMYQEVWQQHEGLMREQESMIQQYKEQQQQQELAHHLEEEGQCEKKTNEVVELIKHPSVERQEQQCVAHPSGQHSASSSPSALYLWSSALQQVGEHAQHIVDENHLRTECQTLRTELASQKAAKAEEAALRKEREEEVQRLSLDGQALLFRNHVLSQQLVSLLQKVEQLERRHRVFTQGSGRNETEDDQEVVGTAKQILPEGSLIPPMGSSLLPFSSSSSLPGRSCSGVTTATVAFNILNHRTNLSVVSSRLPLSGKRGGKYGKKSSIAEEEEKNRVIDTALNSAQLGSSIASLMYTAPLETPLEISSTLSQQLSSLTPESSSFLRRKRVHTLRSVGLMERGTFLEEEKSSHTATRKESEAGTALPVSPATMSTGRAAPPTLPACDLLTGVALQRPPSFVVLHPAREDGQAMGDENGIPGSSSLLEVAQDEPNPSVAAMFDMDGDNDDDVENGMQESGVQGKKSQEGSDSKAKAKPVFPFSLDRFSVHSAEDLVQRNQELLSQLYCAMQKLTEAERRLQQSSSSLSHARASGKDGHEEPLALHDDSHSVVWSGRMGVSSSSMERKNTSSSIHVGDASVGTQRGRLSPPLFPAALSPPTKRGDSREPRSASTSKSKEKKESEPRRSHVSPSAGYTTGQDEEHFSSGIEDVTNTKTQRREQRIFDTFVQDHFRQLQQEQDHLLTSHLLGVLGQVQRHQPKEANSLLFPSPSMGETLHTNVKTGINNEQGKKESQGCDTIMAALVDLCCTQAVQISHIAISEASSSVTSPTAPTGTRFSSITTMKGSNNTDFAKAHEVVLARLLEDLRTMLLQAVQPAEEGRSSMAPLESSSNMSRKGKKSVPSLSISPTSMPCSSPGSPTLVVDAAHVELLQRVMRLLQVANKKEDLLYQILRHGQQQKEHLAGVQESVMRPRGKKRSRVTHRTGRPAQNHHQHGGRRKRFQTEDQNEATGSSTFPSDGAARSPSPLRQPPVSLPRTILAPLLLAGSRVPSSPLSPMAPLPPTTAMDRMDGSTFPKEDSCYANQTNNSSYSPHSPREPRSPLPLLPFSAGSSSPLFSMPFTAGHSPAQREEDEEWEEDEESYEEEEEEEPIWQQLCLPPPPFSLSSSSSRYQEVLVERLAFQQAQRQQLVKEMEEEKAKNLSLLENMWKLEWERDEAVAEVKLVKENLTTMVALEEHQKALSRITEMEGAVQELQTRLGEKEALVLQLQHQLDDFSEKSRAAESLHEENVSALQSQLNDKEAQLVAMEGKVEELEKGEKVLEDQCLSWQERSAKQNMVADSLEKQVHGMESKIRRLQLEFLSRKNVQELLTEMFPLGPHEREEEGEVLDSSSGSKSSSELVPSSFLTHHRINLQLIKDMREERDKFSKQITHNQLYIQRLEEKNTQLTQDLQVAQQQYQQAQLELLQHMQSFFHAEREQQVREWPLPSVSKEAEEAESGSQEPFTPTTSTSRNIIHSTSSSRPASSGSLAFTNLCQDVGYYEKRQRELEQEISYLHQEMKILEDRESGFVKREKQLREELEILSKDPVSENARRYGLAASQSLSEQCAAIHEQNLGLQEELKTVKHAMEDREREVGKKQEELGKVEERRKALQQQVDTLAGQLACVSQQVEELTSSFQAASSSAVAKDAEISLLIAEIQKVKEKDEETSALVQKLRHDNVDLIKQLESLEQDLQDAVEREKEARHRLHDSETALKQAKSDSVHAIAQARAAASAFPSAQVVSSTGGKLGGSTAQPRLRSFPVSLTRILREDPQSPFS